MENKINMTVKDLREIVKDLPDDMSVVIPVIDEDDANHIYCFRHVRTAGVLEAHYSNDDDPDKRALCLNSAADGLDISSQVKHLEVDCIRVMF